jgi:2-polyprenyl-6-methoxyphenol hydroxylase-like FAD-dependent oxidoreductase
MEYDVIIVGAGPVGLLLGCLLQQRGLHVRVLEKRVQTLAHSAAIGITPPSLHILGQLGLAEEFVLAGIKVHDCFVHGHLGLLGRLSFRDIPDVYPFILSLPQVDTIAILRRKLGEEIILTGCEVTQIQQHEDGCVVETPKGSLYAKYVVGCDGVRGRVRELIGMPAPGKAYDCHFVMGDFVDRSDLGDEAHLFFTSTGSVESFPLPNGLRRWVVQTDQRLNAPPVGLVSDLARERTGLGPLAEDQRNEYTFTPHYFNCDRYYDGRVILCGDAAHGMSPVGGQGMNTGFADAEFLAEILCRTDALSLLPVYSRYRRRAAEIAIFRADWGMWLGTWRGRVLSFVRDLVLGGLLRTRPLARRMGSFYAMLTIPFNTLNQVPPEELEPRTS